MAREVYIDCLKRDPSLSLESLRRDVRALRAGASCVVIHTDDPSTRDAVEAFAQRHAIVSHAEAHDLGWLVRLYLLPEGFGEVPRCVEVERRERHLVRTIDPEVRAAV